MNSTIKQLKNLKNIGPNQEWLKTNKNQLMRQFFVESDLADMPLHSHWQMLLLKTAGVFVLVIFAIAGTLGIVSAAQNSLPGDLMYPLKIAVEKAQTKFVISQGAKADLKTEFASRRMREFRQLIVEPESSQKKEQNIAKVVDSFKKEINDVNQLLDKTKDNESAAKAVAVAKQLNLEVVKYENTLAQANKALSEPLQKDVKEAMNSVEKTKIASLKVIIEKSDPQEDPDLTEAVTSQVAAKIEKTETQLAQVKQGAEKISQVLKNPEELIAAVKDDSLIKTEQASDILAQAKQDFADLNLLAALDKVENSRRLIEEIAELVAQNESKIDSETVSEKTEEDASASQQGNLTTPSTLEDAGGGANQEQGSDGLLNILQIQ